MTVRKGKNDGQWFLDATRFSPKAERSSKIKIEVWDEQGQFTVFLPDRSCFFLSKKDWTKIWKEMVEE